LCVYALAFTFILCQTIYLFIPRLRDRANVEQTLSKHRADIEQTSSKHQAGLMEPRPWLKCRPGLAHNWSRVI